MNDAIERYESGMKDTMNAWNKMMHDLYLMISSVLITLSVGAIGFSASYVIESGYHSGKYETCLALVSLVCLGFGILLLIISCTCGFFHLLKNLGFMRCNADYFAARYKTALQMRYKREDTNYREEGEACEHECRGPSQHWWEAQIWLFVLGIFSLIVWVGTDFFVLDPVAFSEKSS